LCARRSLRARARAVFPIVSPFFGLTQPFLSIDALPRVRNASA
jgi:hypothetical protein